MDLEHPPFNATDWLIITDLDGTLIDSEAMNFKVLGGLLVEFGLMDKKETILRDLAQGKDFDDIMKTIGVSMETRKKMEKRLVSLLTQAPTPSLPGAVEHLKYLRGLGFSFSLATDNYSPFVMHVLHELGIEELFDARCILTSDTFHVRKPSRLVVEELMRRSGRRKALIVGNSPKEVALARNAGCPAVIIGEGASNDQGEPTRKETFLYEWHAFGSPDGLRVQGVRDWKEAKVAILELVSKESEEVG